MNNRRAMHPRREDPAAPCFIHLDVHAKFDKEVNRWVAGSSKMDVWSSGEDPKEALDRAEEAIIAFLNEAEQMGTIWDVLKDAGVRVQAARDPEPEPFFERVFDAMKTEYSFPLAFQIQAPSNECRPD